MTPKRWQQIDNLLAAALEREPSERDGFLDQVCAGDQALRREVESLLKSHRQASRFIESPAVEVGAPLLAEDKANSVMQRPIGPYQLIAQLGIGGMGEVYLAHDPKLGRKVALKLLPTYFTKDEQRVRRFRQEARAASALNHPNIITIHDIGEVDDRHYIAMEYVEGETLRQLMASRRMDLEGALDVATQIASALAAAHRAGIVHRDIKPENIMVRPDGYVKVLDFGLAKLSERQAISTDHDRPAEANAKRSSRVETEPGTVMGTADYMSPEQARGQEVDARAEVFSLGVVIYEMVTGRVPFDGETASDAMAEILKSDPPLMTALVPEAPAKLQWIVSKALRKEREERYQTADAMLTELKELKEEAAAARRPARGVRSRLWPWAFTALTILLLVALGAGLYLMAGRAQPIDSIAILPFANASGDSNLDYLSDGIAESITSSLSQLPNLKVIACSSVSRYKGREGDAQAVGRELGVRTVLAGRVLQRGENLSIRAELVDTQDNRRIWGEHYDRNSREVLTVQGDISREISEKLRLKLTGEEKERLTKRYTDNAEAYQLYLKGRYLYSMPEVQRLKTSIEYYDKAIETDPKYALAYSGLADSYGFLGFIGAVSPIEVMPKAKAAAMKAVEIDDTLAEAHSSLGNIRMYYDWDFLGAEGELKRALQLNPSYASAHRTYGNYLFLVKGQVDEGIAEARRAMELDPFSWNISNNMGAVLYMARRYDQAIEHGKKAQELLSPVGLGTNPWLGLAYAQKGLYEQAITEIQKSSGSTSQARAGAFGYTYALWGKKGEARQVIADYSKERSKQGYVSPSPLAVTYAALGENDRAFEWLEKAHELRAYWLTRLKMDPRFDNIRSDPRFANLLRRIGLPP